MDLLSMVLNAGGGNGIRQLAQKFGLDENQAGSAVSSLLPALGQGLARNATSPTGLQSLLGALATGTHQRYIDNPETVAAEETIQDGNSILGHILGSKDVSRQVASNASSQTGIGTDTLKKMLPVVAAMVMGALSKQSSAAQPTESTTPGSGLLGLLAQFAEPGEATAKESGLLGLASKLFK